MRVGIVLGLAVALAWAAARADDAVPERERGLAREIYAQLVGMDTTYGSGETTRAAEAVAARLREAGIPGGDVAVLGPSPRKKNLVARVRGSGAQKPLLLLAHLDVVAARRDDWSVDPFTLLERDGYFYGRGTSDDKAMAAIFAAHLIRLARERIPLRRDVILALTAEEEGGGPENGADWLLREQRALVDAGLVLNEGGGGSMRNGRYLYNAVQAAEKTYMNYELAVRNAGGHSSRPTPENAIYRLAHALLRVEAHAFPIELNDVTRSFLGAVAHVESGDTARDMAALAADPADAAAARRLATQPTYSALLRTTCVATQLEAGHARNALPQLARANVNCRILPGHRVAEVEAELVRAIGDARVELSPSEPEVSAPPASIDPAFLRSVERVTEAMWPGVPVVPTMIAAATDSKYFRAADIPAYGVSGIFVDVDDVRAHGRDERLGVRQFYEGQEFLWRLVLDLAAQAQED
jgi:acetylornithine deacetylase/succinyl-diaminopimelate desuccinylase-like protein